MLAPFVALLAAGSAVAAITLTLPGDITAEAQDSAGADVTYTVTATNPAGNPADVSCDGPGGSSAQGTLTVSAHFPLGSTQVTCTSDDLEGDQASGSFMVTVHDTTPPRVSVPGDVTVEATGPAGAVATYPDASAVDLVDGPLPASCAPASGTQFPLGTTTVTCTATDSHGNVGSASFAVRVLDTKPPALNVPADITVQAATSSGVPSSNAAVAAFLHGASATDVVDPTPTITTNAPGVFPVGVTPVTFTATDHAGNSSSATASVTVLAPPPAPGGPSPPPPTTPAPPPTPPSAPRQPAQKDTTPPANARWLGLKAGDRFVLLRWRLPGDADFDHVEISRSLAAGSARTIVYSGRGSQYRDSPLRNRVQYRYLIVSLDHAGNRSAGAAAIAQPSVPLLFQPTDGATVKKPPFFVWKRIRGATYYNLQLWRGNTKILSVWPLWNHFQLPATWVFRGRTVRMTAGSYRWYVWPGMGPQNAAHYGPLLGVNQFSLRSG